MPAFEAVFDRLAAVVAVEISATFPRYVGRVHLDLDLGTRGNRLPMVLSVGIKRKGAMVQHFGMQYNLPLHPPPPRNAQPDIPFFNIYNKPVLVPAHGTWPDIQRVALLDGVGNAAFGHDPARTLAAIKRDVQAAMVEWNAAP